MRAAFQGVQGAYSDLACKQLLGEKCKTHPYETFDAVFAAVEKGEVDIGVVPVENSLAGSVHQNYDLLLSHDLQVVGEMHLRVRHCLLAPQGATLASLETVRSHPQALAQCSHFFAKHKRIRPVVWFDTAGAARGLSQLPEEGVGAIASEYAATLYGLQILKRDLANESHNFTRFLAIVKPQNQKKWMKQILPLSGSPKRKPVSKNPLRQKIATKPMEKADQISTGFKTSICFTPAANDVGVLFRSLAVFALRDIDLLKIESRPFPLKPFQYRFYLDIAGEANSAPVLKALNHLREMGGELRVFGSYARAFTDWKA